MKTVWVTALAKDEARVQQVMGQLKTYGLAPNGHFWIDNLEKMAWMGARDEMKNSKAALWLVLASEKELAQPSIRYGLSLMALSTYAANGTGFPVVLLSSGKEAVAPATLPTPLRGATVWSDTAPAWQAKLVAQVNKPQAQVAQDYRLDVYGDPNLGQWFEVGPAQGTWTGAMFGVAGAEITFHAVGPKGKLPERTVLEYEQKGFELALGDKKFTAWALKNVVEASQSYFVRVKGQPDSLLFSQYAEGQDAEVFTLQLK
ncbi:MAG: hypothetical protein KGO52_07075 [Nitrospirota bacterium]|nr:hypothetical protein [Nitrospirota bacterium]MDE3034708.1 hypothetical protein [Nitrospirota bacterium]MDE3119985.1 hypothetical protein [Nitrospirota bacterium]MDE3224400.1 hypothetical protein [Nitrospirota bacterium]MDE3242466.1 hypothetical protein [Nitrospirota bacterium]